MTDSQYMSQTEGLAVLMTGGALIAMMGFDIIAGGVLPYDAVAVAIALWILWYLNWVDQAVIDEVSD